MPAGGSANYQSIVHPEKQGDLHEEQKKQFASHHIGVWERLAPSITFWIGAGTYIVCRIIAMASNTYLGGIPWPFVSDTGRERPAYDIFVLGMCAGSITYAWSFLTLYCRRMRRWIANAQPHFVRLPVHAPVLAVAGLMLALAAAPCLVILSIFDVSFHPNVHYSAAGSFFVAATMAMLSWTVFFMHFHNMYPDHVLLAVSTRMKLKCCVIGFIAFVVYLPIGVWLSCPARRLTMDECLSADGLSTSYCESRCLEEDNSLTVLWTYQDCPALYTMRTVAQTVCIVCMLMYAATFDLDLRAEFEFLHEGEQLVVEHGISHDQFLEPSMAASVSSAERGGFNTQSVT